MSSKSACCAEDFPLAAVGLEHPHIFGQCDRMLAAGAGLKWVFDQDEKKIKDFCVRYPQVQIARDLGEILDDPDVKMVVSAVIPCERASLGCAVMKSGKDYLVAKAAFTSLKQLAEARRVAQETGRKYMIYFNERLGSEASVLAGQFVAAGRIGRVIQVMSLGPHRLGSLSRPDWFFDKARSGGILADIGSHHVEQFLFFSGAKDAEVKSSRVANFNYPEHPELEDFGEVSLRADNGASGYFRVDWLSPAGLSAGGDVRTFLLGTKGYMELRKALDVTRNPSGNHIFLVTEDSEEHICATNKTGYPFFGELIIDCLNRTERAMTQAHAFKAAEVSLLAQRKADLKNRQAADNRWAL